jgi:large subunit ribosomal protein L6
MSRIGKRPVKIKEGVTVNINGHEVTTVGPKGQLSFTFRPEVKIVQSGSELIVERTGDTPKAKAVHGLTRSLLENMIIGVSEGWNKGIEIVGVGYRASMEGTGLVLNLGFSIPAKFPAPKGITFELIDNNKINIKGIDKQLVGETAAQIRKIRPPEPYKGKGIRYIGEQVRRKAGKTAKAAGAK